LLISAVFFSQNMLAQQNNLVEDTSPTHSIIFIASILFFIIGFIVLIVLKLRDDAKSEKNTGATSVHTRNRHHHPNHYGHKHQYHQ